MIGQKTYILLRNMGISQIKTLQEVDIFALQRVLGENGAVIWKKANGQDDAPVLPYREQKSMSKEHTFENDTIDMHLLKRTLRGMADELAFELRKSQKLTGRITLKLRYSNFDTYTQQVKVTYTCSDKAISQKALELFEKLYSKRMLVRLVGIKLGELIDGNYQLDLFDDTLEDIHLSQALDKIKERYGARSIIRGYAHGLAHYK